MIGNNFKLRSVLILFVVSSIFILANFVSAATYDATGEWYLSISNGWTDGGENCPIEVDETIPVTITQNGDSFTLVFPGVDGGTLSGSVTDNNYNITTISDPEVTVSGEFTLSSSTSGTGQIDASITEGDITCEKGFDITLTKQGAAPIYDGTGEWDYSTTNIYVGGGPCGPLDPVIATSTVTQIGNDVTLVAHDPEGDITFTGSVSGAIYSLTASFPKDAGTLTLNMIFDVSSNNSGNGKVTYTWTDGIITCNGGFDIAFTKQVLQDVPATGGGSSGCFIATAAYGSLMEPNVKILRDFRDRFLLHNSMGKGFVRLYNTYSPPMADFIAKHNSLKAMVRISLLPVVGVSWVVLKIGPISTIALMLFCSISLIGFVFLRRRKVKN
jgi:hypothetical protein